MSKTKTQKSAGARAAKAAQIVIEKCRLVGQGVADIATVEPNRWNGKRCADDDLVASVKAQGVLQPLIVRSLENGGVEVVAGSRRLDAAKRAKLKAVPVIGFEMTDEQARKIHLIENLQREDPPLLVQAQYVAELLAEGQSVKEVAAALGKHWTWVVRRAKLGELSPKLIKAVENPDHPAHAATAQMLEELAKYPQGVQEALLEGNGRQAWFWGDLRALVEALANETHHLRLAPWSVDDALLVPQAGACTACQKRSSCNPGLFDDVEDPVELVKRDLCLDSGCWAAKAAEQLVRAEAAARSKYPNLVIVTEDYNTGGDRSVLQPHCYEVAKKSDKDALPAFVRHGNGAGTVIRIKLNSTGQAKAARGGDDGEVDDGVKPAEKTLEEKRQDLERRRIALIIHDKIKPAIDQSALPCPDGDPLNQVKDSFWLRLVVAFGAANPREVFAETECGWAAFESSEKLDAEDLHKQLWALLKPVIEAELRIYVPADVDEELISMAQKTAALLGLKWVELLEYAVAALPEPKAWAKQEKI
jgi:ParB/RepB/Spo0J family partition protein